MTVDVILKLPEELVEQAQAAGILDEEHIEEWLRKELERKRRVRELFEDIEKLRAMEPPLTQEEIDAEIRAYRQEEAARGWKHRLT